MAEKLREYDCGIPFRGETAGCCTGSAPAGSAVLVRRVGGHFEQAELNDPRACALRELGEETGPTEESLEELRLRYITLRMKTGRSGRITIFAGLKPAPQVRGTCDEGRLEWVPV